MPTERARTKGNGKDRDDKEVAASFREIRRPQTFDEADPTASS